MGARTNVSGLVIEADSSDAAGATSGGGQRPSGRLARRRLEGTIEPAARGRRSVGATGAGDGSRRRRPCGRDHASSARAEPASAWARCATRRPGRPKMSPSWVMRASGRDPGVRRRQPGRRISRVRSTTARTAVHRASDRSSIPSRSELLDTARRTPAAHDRRGRSSRAASLRPPRRRVDSVSVVYRSGRRTRRRRHLGACRAAGPSAPSPTSTALVAADHVHLHEVAFLPGCGGTDAARAGGRVLHWGERGAIDSRRRRQPHAAGRELETVLVVPGALVPGRPVSIAPASPDRGPGDVASVSCCSGLARPPSAGGVRRAPPDGLPQRRAPGPGVASASDGGRMAGLIFLPDDRPGHRARYRARLAVGRRVAPRRPRLRAICAPRPDAAGPPNEPATESPPRDPHRVDRQACS